MCCPICYNTFDEIVNNKIYITSNCCNNKICGECINSWYQKEKDNCIFCNLDKINKEKLDFYEKETEDLDLNNNIKINEELLKVNDIKLEILNYNKDYFIRNFIIELKDVEKKVIIFSDYSNIFDNIKKICDEFDIKYVDLDKGNIKDIDNAVSEYKIGNAKILLSNSTLFGCGMNFENSTDIIFLHKMDEELEKQVIGRAQRYGRKKILNIIYLII